MFFYKFNVGDYKSHTSHLDMLEDLAYRRMLDYCYLNEIGLPESVEEIARLISMRTECERIANVLRDFFYIENGSYRNKRVEIELHEFKSKSEKASNSAKAKWRKHKESADANALRTLCEGNAKQETRNTKQETLNKKQETVIKSSVDDSDFVCFDDFWSIYPKKTQRVVAEKIWKKMNVNDELFNKIKNHLEVAYLLTDKQYIPNPSTYLNQQRWNDEVIAKVHQQQLSTITYGESGDL